MTIEEAIEHCKEQAAKLRMEKDYGCVECATEHEQLAEWLIELKQRREAEIRLIDANALKKVLSEFNYDMALRIVDIQPTIEIEPVRRG